MVTLQEMGERERSLFAWELVEGGVEICHGGDCLEAVEFFHFTSLRVKRS